MLPLFFCYTDDTSGSSDIGHAANLVSTERKLTAVKDDAEDIVHVGMKCFMHLAPNESYEGTFAQFLRWVGQVPVVADWWNRSSARQGASLALALAKAYHPQLNFHVVTNSFPSRSCSGQPITDEMIQGMIDSTSAYAGWVKRFVITTTLFR